ncbi:MAG: hypothetical protein AAFQ89_10265 [Cyanobacteria bacterium J06626_18]
MDLGYELQDAYCSIAYGKPVSPKVGVLVSGFFQSFAVFGQLCLVMASAEQVIYSPDRAGGV